MSPEGVPVYLDRDYCEAELRITIGLIEPHFMAGYSGGAPISSYGASKAALINLTKSMSQEWAPWNVRVNSLAPGPFMSEMVEGAARARPGFKDLIAEGTLQKRIAEPWEIIGPVVYLASDASTFVTGDDISVSGGMQK